MTKVSTIIAALKRKKYPIALCIILVVAVLVRLLFFNGLHGHDDWLYIFDVRAYTSGIDESIDSLWGLRFTIIAPIMIIFKLFGPSYFGAFIPSILYSLGSVIFSFLIYVQLFKDKNMALLAAFFMALYPLDIFVATTIRGDVEVNFFLGLAFLLFLKGRANIRNRFSRAGATQLVLAGSAVFFAYMTKDYAVTAIGAFFLLFIYESIMKKRLQLPYVLIPVGFVICFSIEGAVFHATHGDFFHRFTTPNRLYSEWIEQDDYENDPSISPEYSFCVLSNLQTESCGERFHKQGFTNSYNSENVTIGLTGFYFYPLLLAIPLILIKRDHKAILPLLFMAFLLAYMTFGTMNLNIYQFMHKETRYFNLVSIFLVVLIARTFHLLPTGQRKTSPRLYFALTISTIIFLTTTGFVTLWFNHQEYIENLQHLEEVNAFVMERSDSSFYVSSYYSIAIDLLSGYGFSTPEHFNGKLISSRKYGENIDLQFLSQKRIQAKEHYVITKGDDDLQKVQSTLNLKEPLQKRMVKTFGSGIHSVNILRIGPEDLVLSPQNGNGSYLNELTLKSYDLEYGELLFNIGLGKKPLQLQQTVYSVGLASHANAQYEFLLNRQYSVFNAVIGLDTANGCDSGSIVFEVYTDNDKLMYRSPVMTITTSPIDISVNIDAAETLQLVVQDAGDGITCDHGTWGDAHVQKSTSRE